MEFNKIVRKADRGIYETEKINQILDDAFLCHVAFQHEGQTMMLPTAYGRKGEYLFLHASAKNFMFSQILNGQTICISVTHLDAIVLARTLFDASVNYRSVIMFGAVELVDDYEHKIEGLKIITDNIIKGRWEEVPSGTENEIKGTMVIKFKIERASAKVREGGPTGDEKRENEVWTGNIPLALKALDPIEDLKFGKKQQISKSVLQYLEKNK